MISVDWILLSPKEIVPLKTVDIDFWWLSRATGILTLEIHIAVEFHVSYFDAFTAKENSS